ncbi:MAG: glycosyltransferase [Geminicoccaceae bacterium]|nr:glycosyltransferase [Geminicoccaceae bacterium]
MKIAWVAQSLASCWNHGNAHFLRGVVRALGARGHTVTAWEPEDCWSRDNLVQDHGPGALEAFEQQFADLLRAVHRGAVDAERIADGAELVVVHEWNEPALVAALGRLRAAGGRFTLLFHDTHHRAVSDPAQMRAFELDAFDGVLAFGASLAEIYARRGWGDRAFVWHEAADVSVFAPPEEESAREGLVWIGNWGDGERTAELDRFLFRPAQAAGLPLDVFGVRYPTEALDGLRARGARYHGWIANADVPRTFARHMATVHVPRRFYVDRLKGIPTIRVFEALACGIPLLSAPWPDEEGLFRPGADFLVARDEDEMIRLIRLVRDDPDVGRALAAYGHRTILKRHTCAHRVDELLAIVEKLRAADPGKRRHARVA